MQDKSSWPLVLEEKQKSEEKSHFNRDAKEFQPMTKLNAEAPEFVPGKAKVTPTFPSLVPRGSCETYLLTELQKNVIKLIRTSGPNGLLVDEIGEKYKEKFGMAMGEVDVSKLLDTLSQYIHVMLAAKVDSGARTLSPDLEGKKFTVGYHKGKRVVDQYIYTMGEGVEDFRDKIVKVIQEFCVRNMTRSDHPLTLATKGLLPAGANGIVRPTGLALSLFAAEWERYFGGAEDFKSLRERFNVQKLMPFLLAIPELDVVGTHPEVRVRMKDMDFCLEEAEKRARTCSPEEISAMQSGGSSIDKADLPDNLSQPRKISCEPSDRKIDLSNSFMGESSMQMFHQQYAAQAAMAAHYQTMRNPGLGSSSHEQAMAQAHIAAMKFQYHQQMMQAAAASMAHSHAVAGAQSIPITSEFFPTTSEYPPSSLNGRFRKSREDISQFPPLPPTNNAAYNPLAAKMQLMKSMNVSRNVTSSSVSRPSASAASLPLSKGSSPGIPVAQQVSKSLCVTPSLIAAEKEKSGNSSAGNSASKSAFLGRTPLKSGSLKLTPVASEAPLQTSVQSPPFGEKLDFEISATRFPDLGKLGIGLFSGKNSMEVFSFPPADMHCPAVGKGGPEDTTASVTPVPVSVNPSPSEPHFSTKNSAGKVPPLDFSLEQPDRTDFENAGTLLPFIEPLNAEEQSASNYLQEMLKLMKEPLGAQVPDSNLLADLAHVLGNSATLLGHDPPQEGPIPEEADQEVATKTLMNILQQPAVSQSLEPNVPLFNISSGSESMPENLVSSFLCQLVQGGSRDSRPTQVDHSASISPELKFDSEAVDKLIAEPKNSPSSLPFKGENGEYDRLTMLLVRAQMKHQLQEPPFEMKTLKTAFDPQYLKMKRPAAKAGLTVEAPIEK